MGETKTTIKSWPEDDRPREKLMRQGAEALSHAELLAILLWAGQHNSPHWISQSNCFLNMTVCCSWGQ
ncbi:MAG: UPF0758 domain-containing protein [Candidatus Marinimicrobia bacterium]|nr:UPF0758 domain-containing protein [Candidatus Neomarinimicrobiota bacterium]